MATNEIYRDADSLSYVVESTIVSGDLVVFASGLVGVAETDAELREDGTYQATVRTGKGVWAIAHTGALATRYVALYATSTPVAGQGVKGTLTTTATANTPVGTLYHPKAGAGAGVAYVKVGA
jgi:predicted RecA/RadA family phage recombinase